jgi:hypothetical protein
MMSKYRKILISKENQIKFKVNKQINIIKKMNSIMIGYLMIKKLTKSTFIPLKLEKNQNTLKKVNQIK